MNYLQYYDLECYLLKTVHDRYKEQGYLSAFDFFCIVVWKANRAKSKIANRLLARGYDDLEAAVHALTSSLAQQATAKDRLYYLWQDWGFRLPMASAILTILYPEEFTVYDWRVCKELGGFDNLAYLSNFEKVWHGYQMYKQKVIEMAPAGYSLRDKDRYLYGKSFCDQLVSEIEHCFKQETP